MDILIDFDGTCAIHSYPQQRDYPLEHNASRVLKMLTDKGHRLILFTMRSNGLLAKKSFGTDEGLTHAVEWFKERGIPLHGVQKNPEQELWTTSPKAYGHLIIDDTCLGIPRKPLNDSNKDYLVVDWMGVENLLKEQNIL